jgi:hypothetical protein
MPNAALNSFVSRVRALLPVLTLLAGASVSAACGGGLAPILTIEHAPVIVPRDQTPTRDMVHDAVVRAMSGRGWNINRDDADGVTGTVVSGSNSATVHVQYDERAYSIHYVDSSPSLKFNGTQIHRKYNDWVDKLSRSIRFYLNGPATWGVQVVVTPPPSAAGPEPAPPTAVAPATPAPDEAPPPPPPPPPTYPTK